MKIRVWWTQPGIIPNFLLTNPAENVCHVVSFSFAEGHSEYWKWKDPRTISYGKLQVGSGPDQPGNQDLHRVQKAMWGKLGYTPSSW